LPDVPVHKTGTAFTKPVDAVVGQTIEAWEAVRPEQPPLADGKTGQVEAFLFCYRARRLRTPYLNLRLIPLLCRKAGVPLADARGRITSHRARATIATELYNAKEPMTLFELQAWLGHRTPRSTQYYAQITPTTLAKAYTDAGYFARNVRTIEVLLDRDTVQNGAAGAGTRGSTLTWATATVRTPSSSSAHIASPAHAATSTCRRTRPGRSCWRRKRISSACAWRSRSPRPSAPRWRRARRPWSSSSTVSQTRPRRQGHRRASSTPRSSRSTHSPIRQGGLDSVVPHKRKLRLAISAKLDLLRKRFLYAA
jgi:hypothetical protein